MRITVPILGTPPLKATMYNRVAPEQKLDYSHNNPVKAGLCQLPEEYKYSSASYYILNAPNEILTQTWSIYNLLTGCSGSGAVITPTTG
jgi:hypothetical protein